MKEYYNEVEFKEFKRNGKRVRVQVSEVTNIKGNNCQLRPIIANDTKAYEFCVVVDENDVEGRISDVFVGIPSAFPDRVKNLLADCVRDVWGDVKDTKPTLTQVRDFADEIVDGLLETEADAE